MTKKRTMHDKVLILTAFVAVLLIAISGCALDTKEGFVPAIVTIIISLVWLGLFAYANIGFEWVEKIKEKIMSKMTKKRSLKKCPFCGENAVVCRISEKRWKVICMGRCYLSRCVTPDFYSMDDAVDSWNRRNFMKI